jgi:hypothetical protein
MARPKGRALSSTTQRVLRRRQNGEGDALRRHDLGESERGGPNKPQTWQPAQLKIVFLKFPIVVFDRNHDRSQRRYRRVDLDASLGHELDADMRATHEQCGHPREDYEDRKPRIFPGYRQPLDHARSSTEETTIRRRPNFETRQPSPVMIRTPIHTYCTHEPIIYEAQFPQFLSPACAGVKVCYMNYVGASRRDQS